MSKREFFEIQADRKVRLSTGERVGIYQWGFIVVQPLSRVWLFETPWTAARQASLSFALSQSLLKLVSIESVMPPNHLILCHLLLLLPSIFPSIRGFSNIFIAIFNTVRQQSNAYNALKERTHDSRVLFPAIRTFRYPGAYIVQCESIQGEELFLKNTFNNES